MGYAEIQVPPEALASAGSRGGELEPEATGVCCRLWREERACEPLDCTNDGVSAGESNASF